MAQTIAQMFLEMTARQPRAVAQLSKDDGGVFRPTSYKELLDTVASFAAGLKALGVRAACGEALGTARHVFTHRVWQMTIFPCQAADNACREGRFVSLSEMNALPLPTAMKAAREWALQILDKGEE